MKNNKILLFLIIFYCGILLIPLESYAAKNVTKLRITLSNSSYTYGSMANASVTLKNTSMTYTGSNLLPDVTVKFANKTLKKGTDYEVGYTNNKNVGTGTVKITGKGNYTGSKSINFVINKRSLSGTRITLNSSNFTYTGKEIKPKVTIKYGGNTLKENTDYKVTYKNNIKLGIGKIIIEGKGNFKGTVTKTFNINQITIKETMVILNEKLFQYTARQIKPKFTVKNGKTLLKEGIDYKVTYKNNVNVGTGNVIIEGIGKYKGTITREFYIKYYMSNSKISVKTATYTGNSLKPAVTVKYGDKTLKLNTDYTITYSNNINAGTGKVRIEGKGKYYRKQNSKF